jgi:hypothetical protein
MIIVPLGALARPGLAAATSPSHVLVCTWAKLVKRIKFAERAPLASALIRYFNCFFECLSGFIFIGVFRVVALELAASRARHIPVDRTRALCRCVWNRQFCLSEQRLVVQRRARPSRCAVRAKCRHAGATRTAGVVDRRRRRPPRPRRAGPWHPRRQRTRGGPASSYWMVWNAARAPTRAVYMSAPPLPTAASH